MADQHLREALVLPIVEKRAVLSKETVETGRVRVTTHVEARQELLREALRHEDAVVERVAVNRPVETAPSIRQEGDVLVYPIVEEVLAAFLSFAALLVGALAAPRNATTTTRRVL